jgi:hypothetical protein
MGAENARHLFRIRNRPDGTLVPGGFDDLDCCMGLLVWNCHFLDFLCRTPIGGRKEKGGME